MSTKVKSFLENIELATGRKPSFEAIDDLFNKVIRADIETMFAAVFLTLPLKEKVAHYAEFKILAKEIYKEKKKNG